MKIDAANFSLDLIETNIIKTFEACTRYCAYPMVRDEEVFLPTHEDILSLRHIPNDNRPFTSLFLIRPKGIELTPMAQVNLWAGTPTVMVGEKAVLGSNNLSLKVGCQRWMILS